MTSRRIVCDSDDEGSDLSPPPRPAARDTEAVHERSSGALNGPDSASTDPSFFRNVYEEQRAALLEIVSGVNDAAAQKCGPGGPVRVTNSSSISDPVAAPAGPKQRNASFGDIIDLTNVTTPGRAAPGDDNDPWDVPSSPDLGLRGGGTTPGSKSGRTYGKRKRGQQPSSLPDHPPNGAQSFPEPGLDEANTSMPAPKRLKRGFQQNSELDGSQGDDAGVAVIPRSEEASNGSFDTVLNGTLDPSSVIYDTLAAETQRVVEVSIPQNAMTSSQRREYRTITSSNAYGVEGHEDLTGTYFERSEDNLHRSSAANTMSTIPYATPSQFASSLPREAGELGASHRTVSTELLLSNKKQRRPTEDDPPSSPDIIAGPASQPRKKKSSPRQPQQDDSWDLDGTEAYEEHYNPRPSKRRRAADESMPDTELWSGSLKMPSTAVAEESIPEPPAEPEAKEAVEEGMIHDPVWVPSSDGRPQRATAVLESEQPKPQKKRGRKKKETQDLGKADEALSNAPDPTTPQPAAVDEKPKKKRGRPRKSEIKALSEALPAAPVPSCPSPDGRADATHQEELTGADGLEYEPKSPRSSQPSKATKDKKAGRRQAKEPPEEASEPGAAVSSTALNEKSVNVPSPAKASLAEASGLSSKAPTKSGKESKENGTASRQGESGPSKTTSAKEVGKVGSSGSRGKVPFRVGLSRKSRIAPLLKSLRK